MFLPTTRKEMLQLGWKQPDIVLITGDSYIDSPFVGVAVIGKVLLASGYRVGIIAQPDPESGEDILRLGEPKLFWGVTGGCIDSMVANRTASGKWRKKDDYTPGGINDKRPDRAVIVYTNLIRKYFKKTVPVILGGLEASLRRVAHYDYWSGKIRRSILLDAKADFLLYGMADHSIIELADAFRDRKSPYEITGLCYISNHEKEGSITLPPYSKVADDKDAFTEMFHLFYRHNNPEITTPLSQQYATRYLIQNPPATYLTTGELDQVYGLEFERELHPYYRQNGPVKALETIRFSLTTHRGCVGECNFCSIAVHQGRRVRWRSQESILNEARKISHHPEFKGNIYDVGGPTANMYGTECLKPSNRGYCQHKRCLFPTVCPNLSLDHSRQITLLKKLQKIDGIKKVFIASGIRYDMILADHQHGRRYLEQLINHHISGQLKIAPEHSEKEVLQKMGKPDIDSLLKFRELFLAINKKAGKKQFLTYYLIAAHPGCTVQDMRNLYKFTRDKLHHIPEQIQIFTPTPSTYSSLMYWTNKDPFDGTHCFVEKGVSEREKQKKIIR